MRKRHALIPIVDDRSLWDLKRAAVLFDQLLPVFFVSSWLARRRRPPMHDDSARLIAELDWLSDNKLLPEVRPLPGESLFPGPRPWFDDAYEGPFWVLETPGALNVVRSRGPEISMSAGLRLLSQLAGTDVHQVRDVVSDWDCEVRVIKYSDRGHFDHGPIEDGALFVSEPTLARPVKDGTAQQAVLQVILDQFPEPPSDTPWEEILAWRDDVTAQSHLARLRHWSTLTAQRGVLDPLSLNDEVQTLIDDYSRYLRLNRYRTTVGIMRTIVSCVPEVLSALPRLDVAPLVEAPFRIAELLVESQERKAWAPGRELAYVVETRKELFRYHVAP